VSLDHVITDVAGALRRGTTVGEACQSGLDALGQHTDALTAVVIRIQGNLRCIAAAGSWQVYSNVLPGDGIVGRVYESGVTAVITDIAGDPDYISLGPPVDVVVCAPVRDRDGDVIGLVNAEFPKAVDPAPWREAIEAIADLVALRVADLGGPPQESANEKLVRHGLVLTTAETEQELSTSSLRAGKDVSGLDTPVLVLATPEGDYEVIIEQDPTPLARKMASVPIDVLLSLLHRSHLHGASYSLGDPARHNAAGFEELTAIGVRTLISIPVGAHSPLGGVLLLADERATQPDAETVALTGLLAAQAWSTRERLRTLKHLHERAQSDPLTGLRHQGSFGERLAVARPGRTGVFAIDIDGFKSINDTYGHQAGDRALVALAQALSTALRSQDELYRIGGDEFAAIVEVQRPDEALGVANRLVIAARAVGHTISVGVAIRRTGEVGEETLRRADNALYVAKRGGRDGVRLSP